MFSKIFSAISSPQKCNAQSGSVAEWSKALVLGTSHFDGVGSNPTAANLTIYRTVIFNEVLLHVRYCT